MASYQRTLRSRRPHARGDVLRTEPGRSARFTNLLHHVDVALLGREFSLAEESGSSG